MRKTIKKNLKISFTFLLAFISVPVMKGEANNNFELVKRTEYIQVYKNIDTNEMYADIDLSILENQTSGELVVYQDFDSNLEVTLLIERTSSLISTCDTGTGDWSAGSPPEGSYTFTPKLTMSTGYVSFKLDMSCYPVKFIAAYDHAMYLNSYLLDSISSSVKRANATSSFPALAGVNFQYHFEQAGIVGGSHVGYFDVEMNENGNVRQSWSY